MANHKTAFYSGAVPLAVGAIVGGGSEEQIALLRDFGMAAGLAFQIQDDVLNLVGTKESTKKDFRSDLTEGKRTLVAIHALQHSREARAAARDCSREHTDRRRAAARRPSTSCARPGSIDYARSYAERPHPRREGAARRRRCRSRKARDLLLSMADFFISRNS